MSIFDSPRSKKGEELYGGELEKYDDLLNSIMGSRSQFNGVNNLDDLSSQYGLKPLDVQGYTNQVKGVYAPQRRNLQSNLARQRAMIAARSGNSATPETNFAPLE